MTDTKWENTRKLFREACFLRASGDEKAAILILSKEMPDAVSAWMNSSTLDNGKKKGHLQAMFQEEMQKVDESVELRDLMLGRFEETFALEIRNVLHDFQILLHEVFGMDTSSIQAPGARPRPTRAKSPTKKSAQPKPRPSVDEMAQRLQKFKEARLRGNKNWQSILFTDIEKIIDTVLEEQTQSPRKKRKTTTAKTAK